MHADITRGLPETCLSGAPDYLISLLWLWGRGSWHANFDELGLPWPWFCVGFLLAAAVPAAADSAWLSTPGYGQLQ